jgi:hypothetical protein
MSSTHFSAMSADSAISMAGSYCVGLHLNALAFTFKEMPCLAVVKAAH